VSTVTIWVEFKYRLRDYVSVLGQDPPSRYIVVARGYSEDIDGRSKVSYIIRSWNSTLDTFSALEGDLVDWTGEKN
jgi:hypothetical protein